MEVNQSLWDSIHPCAFMCWMIQQGQLPADEQVMKTLNAYGYKTPGGFPDFETMNREFERMRPDANNII
jgi:hypothetical protein